MKKTRIVYARKCRLIAMLLSVMMLLCAFTPESVQAATTGSSSSPYVLTAGTAKSVTANDYWFKCKVSGATDFTVTTGVSATVTVYKKTTLSKKQLNTKSSTKSYTYKLCDASVCSNSNTYLVHVSMSSSGSISCKVAQHKDSKTRSNGAMWKVKSTSPVSSSVQYLKYWYVPKSAVSTMVTYVSNSKFLDTQSKLINGTITVSTAIALSGLSNTAALAASIVTGLASVQWGADFKQELIDDISSVGGYSSSSNTYSYGVLLIEYVYDGITFYEVKRWSGGTMYGPGGMVVTWTTSYN